MFDSAQNSPLKNAIREAKLDESFRQDSLYAMRDMEFTRLTVLYEKLKDLFADIPPHIDLFDLGLKASEKPRLWIDMISFVDMNDEKRLYRFFQDTQAKRVLVAESHDVDAIAKVILDYVARRLIAREQLLAMPFAQPAIVKEAQTAPQPQPQAEIPSQKTNFITAAKIAAREEAAMTTAPRIKSKNTKGKTFLLSFFVLVILATLCLAAARLLQLI